MTKITIAIDGFSSTGKSTVAKELAKALNYVYVDSGAMYRAVTLYAMRQGFLDGENIDEAGIENSLDHIDLKFVFNPNIGFAEMYLNGENVESEIRTLQVSNKVSSVASLSPVRRKLVEDQQGMGIEKGVVMDGRDIGTVVFPEAELKIFLTAEATIRAQRRFEELKAKDIDISLEEVIQNLNERDHIDSTRADSPLKQAKDAHLLDNSQLDLEASIDYVIQLIEAL